MSTEKSIESSTSLFSFIAHLLFPLLYHKFNRLSNDTSPHGDMMHLLRKYDVAPLRFAMMRCLPLCAVRHTSFAQRTSLAQANIICRRQTSFKKRTFVGRQKCVFCWRRRRDSLVMLRTTLHPCN